MGEEEDRCGPCRSSGSRTLLCMVVAQPSLIQSDDLGKPAAGVEALRSAEQAEELKVRCGAWLCSVLCSLHVVKPPLRRRLGTKPTQVSNGLTPSTFTAKLSRLRRPVPPVCWLCATQTGALPIWAREMLMRHCSTASRLLRLGGLRSCATKAASHVFQQTDHSYTKASCIVLPLTTQPERNSSSPVH